MTNNLLCFFILCGVCTPLIFEKQPHRMGIAIALVIVGAITVFVGWNGLD